MQFPIYQINAFTENSFGGNPACVVPLKKWLKDEILLKIAIENAVAETAFFIINDNKIHLRWFTPDIEMDLCGHATLATAHCLKTILNYKKEIIIFETISGDLEVKFEKDNYILNLPSRKPIKSNLPKAIKDALNIQPLEVLKSRDYVLIYKSQKEIMDIKINRTIFDQINLNTGGVIVTAEGSSHDFVSRFFTPQATILEDPVTGSAHCSLTPLWSKKLKKDKLFAKQLSKRSGELTCINQGERVAIIGKAKIYSKGYLFIEF